MYLDEVKGCDDDDVSDDKCGDAAAMIGHDDCSPEPEYKEVLLVEEVVAEDTEEVASVEGPGGGAVPQGAGNLQRGKNYFNKLMPSGRIYTF